MPAFPIPMTDAERAMIRDALELLSPDGIDAQQMREQLIYRMSAPASFATDAEIERAREVYGCDDLEIPDDAEASRGEMGAWIEAWVYLPNDEEAHANADDAPEPRPNVPGDHSECGPDCAITGDRCDGSHAEEEQGPCVACEGLTSDTDEIGNWKHANCEGEVTP